MHKYLADSVSSSNIKRLPFFLSIFSWIIELPGFASYLFYEYHCLRVNRVYAKINTFLPPYSKRLFIVMIHRKVFNIKMVNIHFKWRKFLRNIRE